MIAIINPGTQPELRYAAQEIEIRGLDFKYFTSSSYGKNYFVKRRLFFARFSKTLETFVQRRTIPIEDRNVSRLIVFPSLIIRILPRVIRMRLLSFRNNIFHLILFFRIIDSNFSLLIFQDYCPFYWKLLKNRCEIVVILSNASPHYVKSVMLSEYYSDKSAMRYFGRGLPTGREMKAFFKCMKLADRIIVPSNFVKKSFEFSGLKTLISKITVVHLGYSPELFPGNYRDQWTNSQGDDPKALKIIFVGQICWRKGLHYLVQAFTSANLPPGSTLTLVGTSIEGFAENLMSKSDSIIHKNFVSQWNLRELLAEADLFVMPSLIEGFCLSAIEAMAFGIPILVTSETIDGIVLDGLDGLTVSSRNSVAIQKKLEWCIENRRDLLKIGQMGSLKARNFTWKHYGERFCEALELD